MVLRRDCSGSFLLLCRFTPRNAPSLGVEEGAAHAGGPPPTFLTVFLSPAVFLPIHHFLFSAPSSVLHPHCSRSGEQGAAQLGLLLLGPPPTSIKANSLPPSCIHQAAPLIGREASGEPRWEMITGHA